MSSERERWDGVDRSLLAMETAATEDRERERRREMGVTPSGARLIAVLPPSGAPRGGGGRYGRSSTVDVTLGVQALYDFFAEAVSWGYVDVEDRDAVLELAEACGFDVPGG